MKRASVCLAMLSWAGTFVQAADFAWPDELQLHGFLSQGFVQTGGNRFFGPSDDGSWDFREIGVNLSYRPQPVLLFAAQLLSRTAGELDDGRVRIDYALLSLAPLTSQDLQAGLRLGRLKNPLGLYNDARDMPFTRPSIFLPQSIYFDRVRNLELSTDGGGVFADMQNPLGDFYFQANIGALDVDRNVEEAFLYNDWPGRLTTDDPWISGRLMYDYDGGRLRLAMSKSSGILNYRPGLNDFLRAGRVEIDLWILSAQYNAESLTLTAEFMNSAVAWRDFGGLVPGFEGNSTTRGWYLQGAYRVTSQWELLLRYDVGYLNKDDKDGSMSADLLGLPAHSFYAKDLTFGVSWQPFRNLMLRAEYHRVEGTAWLSVRENDPARTDKDWDMFALQASFRF